MPLMPVNTLPVPENCDNCASLNVVFDKVNEDFGERMREWPWVYRCLDCKASTGCHNGTNYPLGKMADARIRKLRSKVHKAFDPLWRSGLMSRDQAYAWLARQLNIDSNASHISWLTKKQLQSAASICAKYAAENLHKAEKRKERRREQNEFEIRKERNAIKLRKSRR